MEFTFYEQTNKSESYLYIIDSFSAHTVLSKPCGLFKKNSLSAFATMWFYKEMLKAWKPVKDKL